MKIILVRHGVTAVNMAKKDGESEDLAQKSGFNVLLKTRRNLERFNIDHIYSSNLKEAKQTADMLGFKDYTIDPRLNELDFGQYKGQLYEQIQKDYNEFFADKGSDRSNIQYPGRESRNDLIKRTSEFLDELVEKDEDVLCVSHGLAIKACLFWVLKDTDNWDHFWIENGALTVIEVKDGKKLIEGVNLL